CSRHKAKRNALCRQFGKPCSFQSDRACRPSPLPRRRISGPAVSQQSTLNPRLCEPSPFLSGFGGSEIPPSLASEEEAISGRQSSLNVAACTFARAADQSLPAACAADSPARLRQILPQSGSPPTKVCYDYSAQPSIAEAGLAPASMSKTEGCT